MDINIGIERSSRQQIADGLSKLLADTYTLFLKTHNYHWNVTGPMFQTLHTQFETQYNELFAASDSIAERIRSLGFAAPGSYAQFSKLTSVNEATSVPRAQEMLKDLIEGHEVLARTTRSVIPAAETGGDEATLDLLTQRLDFHERTAWMLRSHLDE